MAGQIVESSNVEQIGYFSSYKGPVSKSYVENVSRVKNWFIYPIQKICNILRNGSERSSPRIWLNYPNIWLLVIVLD